MATGGSDRAMDANHTVNKLTCAICLEKYRRPKLLPCFHTFCQGCLQGLAGSSPSLVCPYCRSRVVLPPGGVSDLQTNFYIEEDLSSPTTSPQRRLCDVCTKGREATHICLECQQRFCLPCRNCHDGIRSCHGHTVVSLKPEDTEGCEKGGASSKNSEDKSTHMCSKHPGQRLLLHCKQCQADICMQCKLTRHDGHPTDDLVDIQAEARTSLHDVLWDVTQQRRQIHHLVLALHDRSAKLNQQRLETEQDMLGRADTLHQRVTHSLEEAVTSVQTATKELEKSVHNQVEQLQNRDKALEAQQDVIACVLRDAEESTIVSLNAQLSPSNLESADVKQIEEELTKNVPEFHVQHSPSSISQLQLREFIGVLQPVQPAFAPQLGNAIAASAGAIDGMSSPKTLMNADKRQSITELIYSTNPQSSVEAMCPISQNRLWVMYRPERGASVVMKLFDADGQVLAGVSDAEPCDGLITIHDDTVLSWRYYKPSIPLQTISPTGTLISHSLGIPVGHLVPCATNNRQYLRVIGEEGLRQVAFSKTDKLAYLRMNVLCKDIVRENCPGHVSYNAEYCAFVLKGKVKIYPKTDKKSPASSPSSYIPAKDKAIDARFCQTGGQEQLMVLTKGKVHVFDHRGGKFVRYLDTGPQNLLEARCLASNFDQYLWIGCDGGKVVMVSL